MSEQDNGQNGPNEAAEPRKTVREWITDFAVPLMAAFSALIFLFAASYYFTSNLVDGGAELKINREDILEDALGTLSRTLDKDAEYGQLPVTFYEIPDRARQVSKAKTVPPLVLFSVPSELERDLVEVYINCGNKAGEEVEFSKDKILWGIADHDHPAINLSRQPSFDGAIHGQSNLLVRGIDAGGNVLHAFKSNDITDLPCQIHFDQKKTEISRFFIVNSSERAKLIVLTCAIGFVCFILGVLYANTKRTLPPSLSDNGAPDPNGAAPNSL